MSRPKAYEPAQGYMYQILYRYYGEREWEHIDYATDVADKNHLMTEYNMASNGYYKAILLPKKYWNELTEEEKREKAEIEAEQRLIEQAEQDNFEYVNNINQTPFSKYQ